MLEVQSQSCWKSPKIPSKIIDNKDNRGKVGKIDKKAAKLELTFDRYSRFCCFLYLSDKLEFTKPKVILNLKCLNTYIKIENKNGLISKWHFFILNKLYLVIFISIILTGHDLLFETLKRLLKGAKD